MLLLGGSETTATLLNWVVLYLLHHTDVQEKVGKMSVNNILHNFVDGFIHYRYILLSFVKVHNELDRVSIEMGYREEQDDIAILLSDALNYTNAVLSETLRLSSVVPLGVPHVGKKIVSSIP